MILNCMILRIAIMATVVLVGRNPVDASCQHINSEDEGIPEINTGGGASPNDLRTSFQDLPRDIVSNHISNYLAINELRALSQVSRTMNQAVLDHLEHRTILLGAAIHLLEQYSFLARSSFHKALNRLLFFTRTPTQNELSSCLRDFPKLKELMVYTSPLPEQHLQPEGFIALMENLKQNQTLKLLDFSHIHINDEGASALAEVLKMNTTLTDLKFSTMECNPQGWFVFMKALESNQFLTILSLSYTNIQEDGCRLLGHVLTVNKTMTTLRLENNSLDAKATQFLGDGLKTNRTLRLLDLSKNIIQDAGARAIAEGLRENSALTSLDLHRNEISIEGAKAIASSLINNETLKILKLWDNTIFNDGVLAFGNMLRINSTLTSLSLRIYEVDKAIASELRKEFGERLSLSI